MSNSINPAKIFSSNALPNGLEGRAMRGFVAWKGAMLRVCADPDAVTAAMIGEESIAFAALRPAGVKLNNLLQVMRSSIIDAAAARLAGKVKR